MDDNIYTQQLAQERLGRKLTQAELESLFSVVENWMDELTENETCEERLARLRRTGYKPVNPYKKSA